MKANFICVSAVLCRRAEPGDKNLSKHAVLVLRAVRQGTCQKAVLLAILLEVCEGKNLGALGWVDCENGKTAWISARNRISYKGSRQLILFLFLYGTCRGIPCMCNNRLHFCVCCASEGQLVSAPGERELAWLHTKLQ